jgi:hypothetical protein
MCVSLTHKRIIYSINVYVCIAVLDRTHAFLGEKHAGRVLSAQHQKWLMEAEQVCVWCSVCAVQYVCRAVCVVQVQCSVV